MGGKGKGETEGKEEIDKGIKGIEENIEEYKEYKAYEDCNGCEDCIMLFGGTQHAVCSAIENPPVQ